MATQFNVESEKKIAELLGEYHDNQAALLPVLFIAQDQFGYINQQTIDLVASRLELDPLHVKSVVSFYTMYQKKPVGKYHIQLCKTLSCALAGTPTILNHIKNKLGINAGEVTEDGKFSIELVECLAMCGSAPSMIINKDSYENLTPEKVDEILDGLK